MQSPLLSPGMPHAAGQWVLRSGFSHGTIHQACSLSPEQMPRCLLLEEKSGMPSNGGLWTTRDLHNCYLRVKKKDGVFRWWLKSISPHSSCSVSTLPPSEEQLLMKQTHCSPLRDAAGQPSRQCQEHLPASSCTAALETLMNPHSKPGELLCPSSGYCSWAVIPWLQVLNLQRRRRKANGTASIWENSYTTYKEAAQWGQLAEGMTHLVTCMS